MRESNYSSNNEYSMLGAKAIIKGETQIDTLGPNSFRKDMASGTGDIEGLSTSRRKPRGYMGTTRNRKLNIKVQH